MANFDSNQWYHVYAKANNESAMMGTALYDNHGSNGTTFFQPANIIQAWQQWQFSSVSGGYYVLRTRDSGPNGFLVTKYSPDTTKARSQTLATMVRGNLTDDSVYWKVGLWDDGTYFLTNKANDTKLHLEDNDTTSIMSSNITAPQNGQRFLFDKISAINDERFSTVNLPSSTSSSPISSTPSTPSASSASSASSSSSTPSPGPSASSSSSGLSSAAKAAIGGSVGGLAVIGLVLLGLLLWRRRQQQQKAAYQQSHYNDQAYTERYAHMAPYAELPPSEVQSELAASDMKHEMPPSTRPIELPASRGK